MRIGFSGLGRMGSNMAARLLEKGHQVVVLNRSPGPVEEAVKLGALAAESYEDMVNKLGDNNELVAVWLMLPADVTDEHFNDLLPLMPQGGIVIDGGNSDFRHSRERGTAAEARGVRFIDVGTSGGILGRERGYAMMVGGDPEAARTLTPILDTLAPPDGWAHFGPAGSGHFTKMVHNAMEYGMMESLAEGYRLLKEGPFSEIDLAKAATVWQNGSIVQSLLNELTRQALSENPEMTGIDGVVAESGEARWALETAKQLNLPMPAIEASFDVRLKSQTGEITYATKLLAAMRNKFGGHAVNPTDPSRSEAQKK